MLTKFRSLVGLFGACALIAGCSRNADNSGGVSSSVTEDTNSVVHSTPDTNTITSRASAAASSAYNSVSNATVNAAHDVSDATKNLRDRTENALTATKQGEGAADLSMTQNIRQAVMNDGSLSTTAKNVTIITLNGKVTLRGTVKTAEEKQTIDTLAQRAAGGPVDDQLEIKADNNN